MRGPCMRRPGALEPTRVQLQCLHLIEKHRQDRGHAPTIRELCALRGVTSTNGTAECLRALIKKGLLAGEPHAARTLQATPLGLRFLRCFVPAGQDGRSRLEPTGSTTHQVNQGSQAVNNREGA